MSTPTPELDKQMAVIESGARDTLTDFIDWLSAKEYVIAEHVEHEWWDEYDNFDTILAPVHIRPEKLFGEFFGIDLDLIESERRAILDEWRNQ